MYVNRRPPGARLRGWITCFLVFWTVCSSVLATTVVPPSFAELSRDADQIVHGKVLGVRAYREEYQGRPVIRTAVKIEVIESVDGYHRGETFDLRLLGGQVGDQALRVDGMPRFRKDEEVVLFMRGNGRHACPLVGWRYGQFKVNRADGAEGGRVLRADGSPLAGVTNLQRKLGETDHRQSARVAGASEGLKVDEFLALVRRERSGEATQ